MKKTFRFLRVIALVTAIGFFMAACGSDTDEATCTVSFNSNGGSAVTSIAAASGSKIKKPADPSREAPGYYSFAAWYKDADFNTLWNFSTDKVESDITLFAKWTPLKTIGDAGPGGGKIFCVANVGGFMTSGIQLLTGSTASDESFITVYYLEAAPSDTVVPTLNWASPSHLSTDITGTEVTSGGFLGTGKRNTALILAKDPPAPAAKACTVYGPSPKDDWFLPSLAELGKLFDNQTAAGINGTFTNTYYWSSTQNDRFNAVTIDFNSPGGTDNFQAKNTACRVRPIRAF